MKMKFFAAAMSIWLATGANAASVTIFAGDEDCFGLGGSCAVGDGFVSDLGGSFFTDYSTASDPAGTDNWNTTGNLGGPALEFDLTGISGTILSATLSVFYAGLELGSGGDVKINGTSIGSILAPDFQTVALASFANVEALLSDSTTASIAASVSGDGFIVDYMKLDLEVDMPAVPLPASLPLLAVGLGGLGLLARRKRKSA